MDNKNTLDRYQGINSFYRCPEVELFDEKEWSLIMRKYNLTIREIEVVHMILKGFSYNNISKRFNIEPSTVKVHLRNVYKKVNVNSRMMLVLTFIDYAKRCNN